MKKLNKFIVGMLVSFVSVTGVHAAEIVECSDPSAVAKLDNVCYKDINTAVGEVSGADQKTIEVLHDTETSSITISGKNIILDLKDVTISNSDYVLNINNSTVKITGSGSIINTVEKYNSNGVGGFPSTIYMYQNTNLTIDENITVEGYDTISIMANSSQDSQLDVYGTLTHHKDVTTLTDNLPTLGSGVYVSGTVTTGNPIINIHDGATIEGEGVGLYLAGNNKTTIGKATITGASGIAIKSGELSINGAKVTGTYEYLAPVVSGSGIKSTGAAIQIESTSELKINININDGTYTSEHGYAIQEYNAGETGVEELTIASGTFESNKEGSNNALDLSDSFATNFAEEPFIEAGTVFTSNGKAAEDVLKYTNKLDISENGVVGKLHKVTSKTTENGTIEVPANAAEGEEVTITVIANEGFKVSKVSVNGKEITPKNGTYTFIMGTDDVEVTAEFTKIEASGNTPAENPQEPAPDDEKTDDETSGDVPATTPDDETTEDNKTEEETPNTLDKAPIYLTIGAVALTSVTALGYMVKKKLED